jgi:hypothetical protein
MAAEGTAMQADTRWELAWQQRPPEEAHIFNPAFCGELISRTVGEFHKACKRPLNLAVAFLILPLILHKPTRDQLPGRANVAFAGWIADKNPLLAELPGRASRLRPISRESLLFALRHGLLAFEEGGLVPGPHAVKPGAKAPSSTADVDEARRGAGMLGRWFANQGRQSVILQGMGVTP